MALKELSHSQSHLELVGDPHEVAVAASEAGLVNALRQIKGETKPEIYTLIDAHDHLEDPVIVRLLKEIAQRCQMFEQHVVFISHELNLPAELGRFIARFELALPGKDEIHKLLLAEAKVWKLKNGSSVKADSKAIEMLVNNLVGLTVSDIKRFLRGAIYNDGAITQDDLPAIQKAKYDLIGQEGLLSFEYETASFSDVGGMTQLKSWLEKRRSHFISQQQESQIEPPKGVLLLGVQVGGKSLAAKSVAGVWGVPLLRLDFGVLYNKFFGETERNIRKALNMAEVMAPCVLWIDEIEKGIATGENDNGTSRRLLGTLLTWMAENEKRVFVVATANDIQDLPPELIRKGRLDEVFFVDLPTDETRQAIFGIHIDKRGFDRDAFDLKQLAVQSDGFSGAEIEQAVVSACYSADAEDCSLSSEHIVAELELTRPLSVVMAERLQGLRRWAEGRTVSAG